MHRNLVNNLVNNLVKTLTGKLTGLLTMSWDREGNFPVAYVILYSC